MKTFKFKIFEYWFGGVNERILEVQARTPASAFKKCNQIRGNRKWEIVPLNNEGQRLDANDYIFRSGV